MYLFQTFKMTQNLYSFYASSGFLFSERNREKISKIRRHRYAIEFIMNIIMPPKTLIKIICNLVSGWDWTGGAHMFEAHQILSSWVDRIYCSGQALLWAKTNLEACLFTMSLEGIGKSQCTINFYHNSHQRPAWDFSYVDVLGDWCI